MKGWRNTICKILSSVPRAKRTPAAWRSCWPILRSFTAKAGPDLFIGSGAKFDRAGVLALFADESSPVFVADDGSGRVVGYIICRLRSTPSNPSLRAVRTLYVEDLCVDPSCVKQGVGSALMRKAEGIRARSGLL